MSTTTFLGIDPGRDKCGVTIMTSSGDIKFQKVIQTISLSDVLQNLVVQFDIELVIIGNGTTHKAVEKKVSDIGLPLQLVDEKYTTECARREYWKKNPPRGWRKFIPTSMQTPPEPVDAIVAEILIKKFLESKS